MMALAHFLKLVTFFTLIFFTVLLDVAWVPDLPRLTDIVSTLGAQATGRLHEVLNPGDLGY
jgi:hypothetical protein